MLEHETLNVIAATATFSYNDNITVHWTLLEDSSDQYSFHIEFHDYQPKPLSLLTLGIQGVKHSVKLSEVKGEDVQICEHSEGPTSKWVQADDAIVPKTGQGFFIRDLKEDNVWFIKSKGDFSLTVTALKRKRAGTLLWPKGGGLEAFTGHDNIPPPFPAGSSDR
ncbi:hypothetical protein [Synoicihabitans lomoniglobus]|uniref:Uncharacterized protein n=1 Tax=Synoicihabitans lomoniglobus TaxID=2909285 RepID=A0AAE9ZW98_9BACT|nr:hypothetical protein [Opitutaceae bacterium LMO-M01]WED64571.1 hypothetical protein PXH66_19695 [Opitutaceae bacterium LMO-M01]